MSRLSQLVNSIEAWRVYRVGKSSYMKNRHCGYEVCMDEHTFCRFFFLLVATEVFPACLTSSSLSRHFPIMEFCCCVVTVWHPMLSDMLSIWFLWSLVRLDTLILNQNSFGCEGVANLCEELAKCGAQNRILQDSRYSRYSRYSAHIFITEKTCWHVSLVFFWLVLAKVRCLTNFEFFFVGTKFLNLSDSGWCLAGVHVYGCWSWRAAISNWSGCRFFSVEFCSFSPHFSQFQKHFKMSFLFFLRFFHFENRIIWNTRREPKRWKISWGQTEHHKPTLLNFWNLLRLDFNLLESIQSKMGFIGFPAALPDLNHNMSPFQRCMALLQRWRHHLKLQEVSVAKNKPSSQWSETRSFQCTLERGYGKSMQKVSFRFHFMMRTVVVASFLMLHSQLGGAGRVHW